MSSVSIQKNQLKRYFLEDGRNIVQKLESNGIRATRYLTVRGSVARRVILRSGIELAEYDYLILPEVYLRQMLRDYWDLFEMTVDQINKPGAVFMARTLYEMAFRNLLQYIHLSSSSRKVAAIKSWLCTTGNLVRRASDPEYIDSRYKSDYSAWLLRLRGYDSYQAFLDVRNNNFKTSELGIRATRVYGLSFEASISRYETDLVKPDGQALNKDVLMSIYSFLGGHIHGQSAHISSLFSDYKEDGNAERMRSFLIFTAFEVLYLSNNQLPSSERVDLRPHATYLKRITPRIIERTRPQ